MFSLNVTLFLFILQLLIHFFFKYVIFYSITQFFIASFTSFKVNLIVIVNEICKSIRNLTPFNIQSLLIGWSGGVDSQALLAAAVELQHTDNFNVFACHVNHKLNIDADKHAKELAVWAKNQSITTKISSIDVRGYAKSNRLSIEHAGRQLRYRMLKDWQLETPDSIVLTAHHLEDRAETILLNLIKGTGTAGFIGIYPQIDNWLIRPLLGFSKATLKEIIDERKWPIWEDESNSNIGIVRNRIRHKIIPEITQINPHWMDKLVNCSNAIAADALMLDSTIYQALDLFSVPEKFINKIKYKFDPKLIFDWYCWDWGKMIHYLSEVIGYDIWLEENTLRRVILTLCRYLDLYIDQSNLCRVVQDFDSCIYPKRIQLTSDYWMCRLGRNLAVWSTREAQKRLFEPGK